MNINRQQTTVPYYEDKTRLNKSLLMKLKVSPRHFKEEMIRPTELRSLAISKGTLIHKWILENEDFYNDYFYCNEEVPTTILQYDFVRACMANNLHKMELPAIAVLLTIYKSIFSCDRLKDSTVSERVYELFHRLKPYMTICSNNEPKLPVSRDEMTDLHHYSKSIKAHVLASKLLALPGFSEFHINWEHKTGVPCKSLCDRVAFDEVSKQVYLIDLKTTSDINEFKHSFGKYTYGEQLAFYKEALEWYIANELQADPTEWNIVSYIIALDKMDNEVRVYQFSESNLEKYTHIVDSLVEKVQWHLENDRWDHSYEYYTNGGIDNLE